jgi:hypothetical protein
MIPDRWQLRRHGIEKSHSQEWLCYLCALDHGQSSGLATSPALTGFHSMYRSTRSMPAGLRIQ